MPSSSLVDIEVEVGVEIGVEVEVGVWGSGLGLLFWSGVMVGWGGD